MSSSELPPTPTISSATSSATVGEFFPSFFPADMVVSRDAENAPVSRYGDGSWNYRSMSADGSTALTLHFHSVDGASDPVLAARIREQHKALIWLHIDAGKVRAPGTIQMANRALAIWCVQAAERGVDLFMLLVNSTWIEEQSQSLNFTYLVLTPGLVTTMWRNSELLGVNADIRLQAIKQAVRNERKSRPSHRQTPIIPSRVYCSILSGLIECMDFIEREIDMLLDAYRRSTAASRDAPAGVSKRTRLLFRARELPDVVQAMSTLGYARVTQCALSKFIAGRLLDHQTALMCTVVAFTGMRKGEVSLLPVERCLREFEHLGAAHFEVHGFTHKLNSGQKVPTSWITSQQGARAVRLAERIARAILAETDLAPNAGQQALLFPSTESPYTTKAQRSHDLGMTRLRERVCPLVEQQDLEELNRLELARDWERDDIVVGKRWPLSFHQLRRSLAVYAHRSGMVTLPALKAQMQHITDEMTAYYADGFSRARNLVFDKDHFSHEWNAAKAEASYLGFTLGLLLSDEDFFGGVTQQRMSGVVESRSREDTLRLFAQNKLAYRETVLGGCVSTEECKSEPLEPIPYECLETNCVNMVVFSKRLQAVVRSQQSVVATLERTERGSVEHRLEVRHLQVLLKAQARMEGGK
jgi:integrase